MGYQNSEFVRCLAAPERMEYRDHFTSWNNDDAQSPAWIADLIAVGPNVFSLTAVIVFDVATLFDVVIVFDAVIVFDVAIVFIPSSDLQF